MRFLPDVVFIASILLLGAGLPAVLAEQGLVAWTWMLFGVLAWLGAVLVKIFGSTFMYFMLNRPEVSAKTRGALSGLWSAACELGAVVLVLWYAQPYPGLKEGLSLGFGAGCFEVLMVGGYAIYKMVKPDKPPPDQSPWRPVVMSLTERLLSVAGHVASRGLVWIGLASPSKAIWLVPAILFFALVDGVAAYGVDQKWDFEAPRTQFRFYGFLAAVGIAELFLFLLALRAVGL